MFSMHLIKSGEVPEQFKDDFKILFDHRQIADYDLEGDFPLEEINDLIIRSENFLHFVKEKYA